VGRRRGKGSVGLAGAREREGGGGVWSEGVHAEGGGLGGRQEARPAEAVDGRHDGSAREEEIGEGCAWACPGKEGEMGRPNGIVEFFIYLKGSDLIQLKDGLPEF
jgi:hypothetical protein